MCSADMQQTINAAVSAASDASSNAEINVADNPNGSDLQTTWFGAAAGIWSVYLEAALLSTYMVRRILLEPARGSNLFRTCLASWRRFK